ncbi:MAG: 4-(cytidine 5'-diphospho)-2-C-methyl-D-erythritol kinase [Ilumatobacteraceae bacterium]|nr:4-(cytidine 5'-diphospho)-2-C-methyl-D-erythritol kinase [Ilumatobacteraceae bacterium]MDP4706032.1 4-(cytidine 5'-diphospho)-2-C-methyl-D-erythritol kinase [Ilumatobacteraceae bacterium]MDP4714061.1 4-(cytidine 5'-diphospho)-2-C-methyl-D-erythritol kinase [Ilumatobacteraceae bacterium]MDP4937221.1 4-(cytidine 5'-diphospho)-2-C-methyl-D-erythritol kinase [Ilumatobacteraceae bacterium]MDP5114723.1 4-(cytidine 5'-diphospho)-2-C-methyl-D-erythritol kinase [Ilumatobacteraceae bacterium]
MTSAPQLILAPAKLTLSLRVTDVRDDGYHLIDAVMTTLELHDELHISDDHSGLDFRGPYSAGITTDSDNLVSRALAFVDRVAHVVVTKNIPHGGGLGGGSSNAAAIFRWAQRTSATDIVASAAIGADVPFCIVGGQARVTGIGEIVEPMAIAHRNITLIIPPLHVSTPAVYKAWDALGHLQADGPNDLEPAALVVEPKLVTWRARIIEATGQIPTLAGSGATWFIADGAADVAQRLREALPDAQVVETRTGQ